METSDVKLYPCYSMRLKDFLKSKNIYYLNKKTYYNIDKDNDNRVKPKFCWYFVINEELSKYLKEFTELKNKFFENK